MPKTNRRKKKLQPAPRVQLTYQEKTGKAIAFFEPTRTIIDEQVEWVKQDKTIMRILIKTISPYKPGQHLVGAEVDIFLPDWHEWSLIKSELAPTRIKFKSKWVFAVKLMERGQS